MGNKEEKGAIFRSLAVSMIEVGRSVFSPNGRVFREGMLVEKADREAWSRLLEGAHEFAAGWDPGRPSAKTE
jgi:hypothetical protein